MTKVDPEIRLRLTAEIAVAYLTRNGLDRSEIGILLRDIRVALDGSDETETEAVAPAAEAQSSPDPQRSQSEEAPPILAVVRAPPPVDPADSVSDDYLICLEDGMRFRSLKRHLMAKYSLTPEQYRRKWNLPPDYPMVAPSYARDRSEVAKRIGLGVSKKPSRAPSKARSTNR